MPTVKELIEQKHKNIIEEPYGFVYITTNLINGKKYIGRCKMQTTRPNAWKYYLGSGVILENAIKKYGRENFSKNIISFAYSEEELNKQEIELIEFFNATVDDNYYNISGGQYNSPWMGLTEEQKQQCREKMKEHNFWNNASAQEIEERKHKMSEQVTGVNNPFYNHAHSEETKQKISSANKGKTTGGKNVSYWKNKTGEDHCMYGYKFSDNSKKKMSDSAKERIKRNGCPSKTPICLIIDDVEYKFELLKDSYDFLCERNLLLHTYKRTIPCNLCFDSYRKKIKNNVVFKTFLYYLI